MKKTPDIESRSQIPKSDLQKYWGVMTLYEKFEHIVVLILSIVISIIVVFALLQLIYEVVSLITVGLFDPLDHKIFQTVFGMIMTLLIAMEFKHSLLTVLERRSHVVQARGVIMIALLALARKLIILDFSLVKPEKLAALGFVVLVLGIVYYLLKRCSTMKVEN